MDRMILKKNRKEIIKPSWKIWDSVVKNHIFVVNVNEELIIGSVFYAIIYIYISLFKFMAYLACF